MTGVVILPDPEHLWQGNLAPLLAASLLYTEQERRDFLNRTPDERQARAFQKRFETLLGWSPPLGALEWEAHRSSAGSLPVSHPWTGFHPAFSGLSDEEPLSSLFYTDELEEDTLLDKLLASEDGVEFLCTGLFRPRSAPFADEGCRISLLPHLHNAIEVFLVDPASTLIDERSPSLLHFFLRRWNLYEISEWFREYTDIKVRFALDPEQLEGRLKAFEYLARDELIERLWYRDAGMLRRRSFWLFGHPSLEPIPGFIRELRFAPSLMDWELELPLLSAAPVLACYWMLAHLFLGNREAARRTAQQAAICRGSLVRALAAKIIRILESPEKGGFARDALQDLQETTLMCARPHQLESEARIARDQLLSTLARDDSDVKPVPCPDFLWKI